jgi:Protein of unknown function (DUF295)/F-box domain
MLHSLSFMGSWSELPFDVLEQIAEKLRHADLTHFSVVCKSWQSLYLENLRRFPKDFPLALCHPRPFGAPILLLSCKPNSDSREYMSLHEGMVNGRIFLPEATYKWICGSSWGWLVLSDTNGQDICLYNPLTRAQIQLPSLNNSNEFMIKAIVSSDPLYNRNDCIVMAIVRSQHRLYFCKLGDETWTKVVGYRHTLLEDVVFYEGKFYSINRDGTMISCSGNDPNVEHQALAMGPNLPFVARKRYLVASGCNLLQVIRYRKSYPNIHGTIDADNNHDNDHNEKNDNNHHVDNWKKAKIVKFVLFKLETNTPSHIRYSHKWVEVDSLNEHSLFIGFNGSVSIPANLLPNCKGNRIYFKDDHFGYSLRKQLIYSCVFGVPILEFSDIGIFDMDEKTVISYSCNHTNDLTQSVWFTPNPW